MADNINNLYENLSKQLHLSPQQVKSAADSGNIGDLLKNADRDKAKQVESILSDPEKTKQLLNSPQAQALMKLLSNGK